MATRKVKGTDGKTYKVNTGGFGRSLNGGRSMAAFRAQAREDNAFINKKLRAAGINPRKATETQRMQASDGDPITGAKKKAKSSSSVRKKAAKKGKSTSSKGRNG